MEPTSPGDNRTGAAVNPKGVELMLQAVEELSPPVPISTLQIDRERQTYIIDADSVGSIPPTGRRGKKRSAKDSAPTVELSLLLDKLGERIAFERTGTRLYGALITKYLALANAGEDPVSALGINVAAADDAIVGSASREEFESPIETLQRIRSEELAHFRMLCDCVTDLGGDPTVQTPCADVVAAACMGLMQVLTDPRTTFAQCLNAMLTAELTDNAAWELLAELAELSGHAELIEPFTSAFEDEQRHLVVIRTWLRGLLTNAASTPAV